MRKTMCFRCKAMQGAPSARDAPECKFVCECVSVLYVSVRQCVCVFVRVQILLILYSIFVYIYIYIYLYRCWKGRHICLSVRRPSFSIHHSSFIIHN